MNFEFLKNLRGLGYIYENCSNAEKLVNSMPVQSVFTSRKSAELLAKFIYMAAHNQEMEQISFADILADPTVRNFIHNRDIMDAFHYIRKSGNRAVHSDSQETSEDAISVLKDLHYVAGETACMLGLASEYPGFETAIGLYPDIQYRDEENVNEKAQKMFLEYIDKYNAQVERDKYFQNRIDDLINEFDIMRSVYTLAPGDVDLNEVIEFKHRPVNKESIKIIQAYFGFLGIRALKKLRGELPKEIEDRDLEFAGELTVYGDNGYSTSDLAGFVYGILNDLPTADGFRISSKYFGPSVAPWFDVNSKKRNKEFRYEVDEIGKAEDFTYVIHEFLYNHGEGGTAKYENGKWVNLEERYSSEILDKDFGEEWWCWNLDLDIDFDFEKYPDIINDLHDCVRKHIPEDQIVYCESAWEDGDLGILCCSISWYTRKLRVVQDFLDELNRILQPIIKECDGFGDGNWYIKEAPFAIATWNWTDDGFKLTGTEV